MSLQAMFPRDSSAVRLEIADLQDDLDALRFRARAFRHKMTIVVLGGLVAMVLVIWALENRYDCGCYGPPSLLFMLFASIGLVGGLAMAIFGLYNRFWGLELEARRREHELGRWIDELRKTLA